MRTNDSRNLNTEALNERRGQVVSCLNQGMTQKATGELCGMAEGTVRKIERLYAKGGLKAVLVKKDGRPIGIGRTLTSEQEKDAQKVIADRTPDQLKLPYALWNRNAVMEMIEERYDRKLAIRTVGNYLKRWGYTPQKPLQRAYEQNPAAVRTWLDQTYPLIQTRAKEENADIHWGDETGLRSDDVRGRSYSPRGITPEIRVNQKRHGCSILSTVTNKGGMRWMCFEGGLNAQLLIKFLKRLIKNAPRKIFLILDDLRVHHSKLVKAWAQEHSEHIDLHYLPSVRLSSRRSLFAGTQPRGIGRCLLETCGHNTRPGT